MIFLQGFQQIQCGRTDCCVIIFQNFMSYNRFCISVKTQILDGIYPFHPMKIGYTDRKHM